MRVEIRVFLNPFYHRRSFRHCDSEMSAAKISLVNAFNNTVQVPINQSWASLSPSDKSITDILALAFRNAMTVNLEGVSAVFALTSFEFSFM